MMKFFRKFPAIFLALPILFMVISSCNKEDDISEKDDKIIRQYLADNNLTATKTASGLYYLIEEAGSSLKPNINSEVRVQYTGFYTDGEVFDSNVFTYPLYGFIQGWQEGLQYFGKGGKGMLFVPSKLGYGSNPPAGIPANAVLIFNIYLIDVKN